MEHVQISLERYANMEKAVNANTEKLEKQLQKAEKAYNELLEQYRIKKVELQNLVEFITQNSPTARVGFSGDGNIKITA